MPILEGRPCAKKLFDKKALTSLQTALHKEVGKHWGLERGQEESTAEHLDTVAFKLKKMKEAAKEAEQRADTAKERKKQSQKKTLRLPNKGKLFRKNIRLHRNVNRNS